MTTLRRGHAAIRCSGFGVESAVVLLTPVALTVAKDVLGFLREQLKKQADEHGDEAFDWLVKKLFRRGDDKPDLRACRAAAAGRRAGSRADRRAARGSAQARDREGEAAQAAEGQGGAPRRLARRQPRDGVSTEPSEPSPPLGAPTQPVRLPVGHDVPLPAAAGRGARREPLRLELAAQRGWRRTAETTHAPSLPAVWRTRASSPAPIVDAAVAAIGCSQRVPTATRTARFPGGCSAARHCSSPSPL